MKETGFYSLLLQSTSKSFHSRTSHGSQGYFNWGKKQTYKKHNKLPKLILRHALLTCKLVFANEVIYLFQYCRWEYLSALWLYEGNPKARRWRCFPSTEQGSLPVSICAGERSAHSHSSPLSPWLPRHHVGPAERDKTATLLPLGQGPARRGPTVASCALWQRGRQSHRPGGGVPSQTPGWPSPLTQGARKGEGHKSVWLGPGGRRQLVPLVLGSTISRWDYEGKWSIISSFSSSQLSKWLLAWEEDGG